MPEQLVSEAESEISRIMNQLMAVAQAVKDAASAGEPPHGAAPGQRQSAGQAQTPQAQERPRRTESEPPADAPRRRTYAKTRDPNWGRELRPSARAREAEAAGERRSRSREQRAPQGSGDDI